MLFIAALPYALDRDPLPATLRDAAPTQRAVTSVLVAQRHLTRARCLQAEGEDDEDEQTPRSESFSRNPRKNMKGGKQPEEDQKETEQARRPEGQHANAQGSTQAADRKGIGMYIEPAYAERPDRSGAKVQVGLRVKSLLPGSPAALSAKIKVGHQQGHSGDTVFYCVIMQTCAAAHMPFEGGQTKAVANAAKEKLPACIC
jgi:hypothetical protein